VGVVTHTDLGQLAGRGARRAIIGTGDFSVFGFDVYNARLWSAARPLSTEQPFALELIYRRDLAR
jgi:hypothetical protein